MSPSSVSDASFLEVTPLRDTDTVATAVSRLLELEVPAMPAVDERDRYAGIFGEREFFAALFPGYVSQLRGSAFLRRALDTALEKRDACRAEPIGPYLTTDHVDVGRDYSDVQVAEVFLHHRVLIVPVIEDGRVLGMLTRRGYFRTLAERFVSG